MRTAVRPVAFNVIRHMLRAARSYLTALRASRFFGRAVQLRAKARNTEAMVAAREALAVLSQAHVIRTNPAEASALTCATVLLEEIAQELHVLGADERGIADSLACIRGIPKSDLVAWIPHLEWRLHKGVNGAL